MVWRVCVETAYFFRPKLVALLRKVGQVITIVIGSLCLIVILIMAISGPFVHPLGALAFVGFVVVLLGWGFLSDRKKSIKEGTWAGLAGAKAAHLWNSATHQQRDLMLGSIGLIDGPYHDDLLERTWQNLSGEVQTSLLRVLQEIRDEQRTR